MRFVVEKAVVTELVAYNGKAAVVRSTFSVHQLIAESSGEIGIGAGEGANHRSGGLVLRDRAVTQDGVDHGDGKGLFKGEATGVGGANADAVAALVGKTEGGGGEELAATDRKAGIVISALAIDQGIGEGVAGIGIAADERADEQAGRLVRGHGGIG